MAVRRGVEELGALFVQVEPDRPSASLVEPNRGDLIGPGRSLRGALVRVGRWMRVGEKYLQTDLGGAGGRAIRFARRDGRKAHVLPFIDGRGRESDVILAVVVIALGVVEGRPVVDRGDRSAVGVTGSGISLLDVHASVGQRAVLVEGTRDCTSGRAIGAASKSECGENQCGNDKVFHGLSPFLVPIHLMGPVCSLGPSLVPKVAAVSGVDRTVSVLVT